MICMWVVYKIKDIPGKFNEGKYIAFSLANHFQVALLALLLSFFINDKPDRVLMIKSMALLGSTSITLVLMFVPKIIAVHQLVSRNSEFVTSMEITREAKAQQKRAYDARKTTNSRIVRRRSSLNSDDEPGGGRATELEPRPRGVVVVTVEEKAVSEEAPLPEVVISEPDGTIVTEDDGSSSEGDDAFMNIPPRKD